MMRLLTEALKNRGLTRRQLLALGVSGFAGWLISPLWGNAAVLKDDLEIVSLMPEMAGRDEPLLVFRDFVSDADVEVKRYIRQQLGQNENLFGLLKKKIAFDKQVQLSVEDMRVRLMYVPQLREGPGTAYQHYCRSILDFLFEMLGTDNFYKAVTSPSGNNPPIAANGISAFLVHRLAKDYQAICRFTAESGRYVKYRTTGTIFSNHLGAVDLEIEFITAQKVRLRRKPFTIWQNSSNDVYSLLVLPVEETLHYYVGRATDRQLAEAIRLNPPANVADAQQMAEEWIAVEEAIVGGLVSQVVRDYGSRQGIALSPSENDDQRLSDPTLPQYKYRRCGLAWVQKVGFHAALDRYMRNPAAFRDRIVDHHEDWSAMNSPAKPFPKAN